MLLVTVVGMGGAVVAPAADRPAATSDGAHRGRPSVYALYRQFDALPGVADRRVRDLWAEGLRLETEEKLLQSARRYAEIVELLPGDAHAYWRVSRNYWRYGDVQATPATRLKYFDLADDWAGRGLEVDPECGPCCLQKFLAMASTAMTRGIFTAVRQARTMAQLLDRGIALQPSHADNEWNSTLGNLYVAASHFYRVTPEWFWVQLIVGVRGDHPRAVEYARRAHAVAPARIDYTVALGAALLCLGTDTDEPRLLTEGVDVLRRVPTLPHFRGAQDPVYVHHAETLIARPDTACSYSPDGWLDVKGALAESKGSERP
jgi:hypothetical protein